MRTCPTLVQHALQLDIGGAAMAFTQGELSHSSDWAVLVGQSEVMLDSPTCTVDGYPQLASLGVWRETR